MTPPGVADASAAADAADTAAVGSAVHVWHASVTALAPACARLTEVLDPSERARAARFAFERDRLQFLVAHGVVRFVLAHYLGCDPARIRFETGGYGKPSIVAPATDLAYNLSHSSDAVLVAVARGRQLGVDIELVAGDTECEAVAEMCFSAAERASLSATSCTHRRSAFFACWARKEAYIKATGEGVTRGLDHFDVTLGPEAALLADRRDVSATERWSMRTLDVRDGYAAALVYSGPATRVVVRDFACGATMAAGD